MVRRCIVKGCKFAIRGELNLFMRTVLVILQMRNDVLEECVRRVRFILRNVDTEIYDPSPCDHWPQFAEFLFEVCLNRVGVVIKLCYNCTCSRRRARWNKFGNVFRAIKKVELEYRRALAYIGVLSRFCLPFFPFSYYVLPDITDN